MPYSQLVGIPGAPGATGVNESPQDNSIALLGATTAAMNLYVDPVAGLDTNPGTSALPFRTIAAALAAVPLIIKHFVTINLASGTYPETICNPPHRLEGGILHITGSPKQVEGVRTASIFSSVTIGTALAGWGVNDQKEIWVRTTGGLGAGQFRKIISNTTDTLTVSRSFSPAIDGTTQYDLVTPGALITGTSSSLFTPPVAAIFAGMGGSAFRNVLLSWLDFVNGTFAINGNTALKATGCAFRAMVQLLGSGLQVILGRREYLDDAGAFVTDNYGCLLKDTATGALWANYTNDYATMYTVIMGSVTFRNSGRAMLSTGCIIYPGSFTSGVNYTSCDSKYSSLYGAVFDGISGIAIDSARISVESCTLRNCAGGFVLTEGSMLSFVSGSGGTNTGPVFTLGKNCVVTLSALPTVTVVGGGLYKSGNRPVGTAWADLTTYGPDDDGSDQKSIGTVPGGGGDIALGRALNGMLASGLVRCHDLTAGAVLAEAVPAPGGGQFSVNYTTGAVTFNVAEAGHVIVVYYRPVSYTGARIG